MENGGGLTNGSISAEDVISKLKDDGDFDRLRLNIIRKLKQNDELRRSIISKVTQSSVLNRPGAENMKPRQLSDAIHQEVGEEVMSQISDGVWDIIRSGDGMKHQITETVQSVYNKLLNTKGTEAGESSHVDLPPAQKGCETNAFVAVQACEIGGASSDKELNEPPGFSSSLMHQNDKGNNGEQLKEKEVVVQEDGLEQKESHKGVARYPSDALKPDNVEPNAPPVFSGVTELEQQHDDNDEGPDVPPGFG